jgi:hypothetical protein
MEMKVAQAIERTPWHLWVVGVISAVWNAGGVYDFVMTNVRDVNYLAPLSDAERAYFFSLPAWTTTAWALGVWGALAGSLLLLLRSRFAIWAFALALAGLAGITLFEWTSDAPPSLSGARNVAFTAAIWIVTIALLLYALAMRRRGVLR